MKKNKKEKNDKFILAEHANRFMPEDYDDDYPKFYYHINLDERGEFYADVRDENDKTVFEIKYDPNDPDFEEDPDFFINMGMKHTEDIKGLEEHLKELDIIPADGELKSAYE